MDKLEEHIRKNRQDFDRYNPPDKTWKRISRELKMNRPMRRQWFLIAAMIIVIMGTAIVLFKPEFRWSEAKRLKDAVNANSSSSPQLKETEIYYTNLINSLYKEATPLLTGNPEIKKELNGDLSQIDSLCTDIKKDLKDNISNQEVVEALILNYRTKIRILEDMLTVLKENENNPEKTKGNEL
jgi:hypothetical protein